MLNGTTRETRFLGTRETASCLNATRRRQLAKGRVRRNCAPSCFIPFVVVVVVVVSLIESNPNKAIHSFHPHHIPKNTSQLNYGFFNTHRTQSRSRHRRHARRTPQWILHLGALDGRCLPRQSESGLSGSHQLAIPNRHGHYARLVHLCVNVGT